jgi:hypothetical protein
MSRAFSKLDILAATQASSKPRQTTAFSASACHPFEAMWHSFIRSYMLVYHPAEKSSDYI